MNTRTYENIWLSINTFYKKTYTELLNLSVPSASGEQSEMLSSEYSAYIYDDETQQYLPRQISVKGIEIPYFSSLKLCDSISEHVFNMLYFALNTTKLFAEGKSEQRLLASVSIKKSNRMNVSTCEEYQGHKALAIDVINRINAGEAEWGLVSYFTTEGDNHRSGIFIQLIHNYFTNVFFIPIDCTIGKALQVAIQTNETELFSSGNDFDEQIQLVNQPCACFG
jgi:hypothetical protein